MKNNSPCALRLLVFNGLMVNCEYLPKCCTLERDSIQGKCTISFLTWICYPCDHCGTAMCEQDVLLWTDYVAVLESVSLCFLHDLLVFHRLQWCLSKAPSPQIKTDALSPKHAQRNLTGPGKIAFNQSMEWLGPDDCSIGCDGFSFVDVTEALQASRWIWWGEWQVLSLHVFLYV